MTSNTDGVAFCIIAVAESMSAAHANGSPVSNYAVSGARECCETKGVEMMSEISNTQLKEIRDKFNGPCRAWQIKEELAKVGIQLDESTIRGRFIEMNEPLSGKVIGAPPIKDSKTDVSNAEIKVEVKQQEQPRSKKLELIKTTKSIIESLKNYIPSASEFIGYIQRPIDARLALHYDSSRPGNWKYPLTQGKQGTGKTMSHMFYAYQNQLPFFLFSCYEDYKLNKAFGDKTIINGTLEYVESILVQAIQGPSLILWDEINAVSNENSVDFHALLQNRELFVKDAGSGKGKVYKVHDDCKIGFAQNPKSAKYIGGNIKPSSFLGRCTYLTYPEFGKKEIAKAIKTRFPNLIEDDVNKFIEFYFACVDTIEQANIPVDISIRQLNNVIDLYNHGMPLKDAIEDGLTSIMDAASQPKNKEAFKIIAEGVWKEMMNKSIDNTVGKFKNFLTMWRW